MHPVHPYAEGSSEFSWYTPAERDKCLLAGPEDNDLTGLVLSAEAFDGQGCSGCRYIGKLRSGPLAELEGDFCMTDDR